MKTPGLGINPVESFNTLNLQSPVEKSDNLPQVSSTQTSPAAKLILNSAVTRLLQDLEICLGRRLPFRGTFPFLVDLQPLCNRTGFLKLLDILSSILTIEFLLMVINNRVPSSSTPCCKCGPTVQCGPLRPGELGHLKSVAFVGAWLFEET